MLKEFLNKPKITSKRVQQKFKPRFRIPSNIEAEMRTWKEHADQEEEENLRCKR